MATRASGTISRTWRVQVARIPHPVVHEKDLAAPVQFPADGRLDDRGLRQADIGPDGPAVLRRGVDQAQLPEAGEG